MLIISRLVTEVKVLPLISLKKTPSSSFLSMQFPNLEIVRGKTLSKCFRSRQVLHNHSILVSKQRDNLWHSALVWRFLWWLLVNHRKVNSQICSLKQTVVLEWKSPPRPCRLRALNQIFPGVEMSSKSKFYRPMVTLTFVGSRRLNYLTRLPKRLLSSLQT